MGQWWQKTFGNWADPELYELTRQNLYDFANEEGIYLDSDPECWNEADFADVINWPYDDPGDFEAYHGE